MARTVRPAWLARVRSWLGRRYHHICARNFFRSAVAKVSLCCRVFFAPSPRSGASAGPHETGARRVGCSAAARCRPADRPRSYRCNASAPAGAAPRASTSALLPVLLGPLHAAAGCRHLGKVHINGVGFIRVPFCSAIVGCAARDGRCFANLGAPLRSSPDATFANG